MNLSIFNLPDTAANEEVEAAYKRLKKEYRDTMFYAKDEKSGKEAAEKLEKLEAAMQGYQKGNLAAQGEDVIFKRVSDLVKANDFVAAQEILDNIVEHSAEWHYYQALLYYQKGWHNECKRHLEIAIGLNPTNQKYQVNYKNLLLAAAATPPEQPEQIPQEKPSADCCAPQGSSGVASCLNGCCFGKNDKD